MVKIYTTMRQIAEDPINDGEVYIFDFTHIENTAYPYQVDIAGVRSFATFLRLEDAQEYAEFLQHKRQNAEQPHQPDPKQRAGKLVV
jgi:hypothetical protein